MTFSPEGAIARVLFPGGLMTGTAARQLEAAADQLREDRAVRVIVLSAGSSFCDGASPDLDRFDVDPVAAFARIRPPIVAAISGRCHSVGLELALVADIRLCTNRSSFAMPEVPQGVLPCWGGTQRLSRAIRPAEAAAMILLGTELDAARALSLGLVHAVHVDVAEAASEIALQLSGYGPLALELAKEAVHRGADLGFRDGLRLEGDLNHLLAATEDRAEGLAAFFAKRPPDFAGR